MTRSCFAALLPFPKWQKTKHKCSRDEGVRVSEFSYPPTKWFVRVSNLISQGDR